MNLLVSIHDVAPPFLDEVQWLHGACHAVGIAPALLVVPAWHGRAPLAWQDALAAWVRAREGEGCDVLLHGLRHDESGQGRGLRDWVRAIGRTDREGEFLTLGMLHARARIERGLTILHGAGLSPVGFVPPAWLTRAEHRRAVRDAGLPITEDVAGLWLTRPDAHLPAPVIRWSARSPWRATASCAVAAVRDLRRPRPSLLRVALHPQDVRVAMVRDSIRRTLERCASERRSVTYRDLARQGDMGRAA